MYLLKKYSYLSFILIFSLTIFLFGINDLEEYRRGTFSTIIFWSDLSSFFSSFFDFYGPGTKVPLGPGPFLHPLNFLLFDLKIYYTAITIFHLYIQLIFTQRILKFYKIKYNSSILSILLIFSIPNVLFGLSEDWISCFISYTLLPPVFYYLIKILEIKSKISYYKFSLIFCFWIINGTLSHISLYIIFLFIFFLLSIKNSNHLKNIFDKTFIICLSLILLILGDRLFYIIRELSYFDGYRIFQSTHDLRHFIEIFFPFKNFLSDFPINRLPGNPILIYSSLFFSSISILLFLRSFNKTSKQISLKFFLKKLNKDLNFKFSILFLLFLFFSIIPVLGYINAVGAGYLARDIYIYIAIFILFINYKKINFKLKFLFNFLLIFYGFLFFGLLVSDRLNLRENNFVLNKNIKSSFISDLKSLNLKKNDYKRVYISPNLMDQFAFKYKSDGIYAITDLIKFNLAPFNGDFKLTSMKYFGDERNVMAGFIDSHIELMTNDFFLNSYKINYLMITSSELSKFNFPKNYNLIKSIKTSYDEILLFERNVVNYSINEKNFNILKKNLSNCKVRTLINKKFVNTNSHLDCFLKNRDLFKPENYKLERKSNGKFVIENFKTNNYILLPFVFDSAWHSKNFDILQLENYLLFLKKRKLTSENEITIEYFDKQRFILKILSTITFFSLLIIVLKKSLKI